MAVKQTNVVYKKTQISTWIPQKDYVALRQKLFAKRLTFSGWLRKQVSREISK